MGHGDQRQLLFARRFSIRRKSLFACSCDRSNLGASVVADSAQFSSCITELGDPQYIGTALTLQMCLGFLLTTISIELIPKVENHVGWRYAFMILAPGPLFGMISMLRLRGLPEAVKIAHGKR